MSTQLEIQPRELRFVVELNKQSKCMIRLVNKTDQHVAFKVKTTSPKKYCVRPNAGVINPKDSHEFVVIMQAQKAPVEMTNSKDKFLIQNTIVPEGATEKDVTSETFSKGGGKHIEESKLRVFFVNSPVSSESTNSLQKQVDENSEAKSVKSEDKKADKSAEVEPILELKALDSIKSVKFDPTVAVHSTVMKGGESEVTKDMDSITKRNDEAKVIEPRMIVGEEEQKIFKDIEEMKAKFHELESKLNKAEVTILKLADERKVAFQDKESLQQEMAFLRRRKIERKVQDGFPLVFVCMVALLSLIVGYNFHP